MNEQDFRKGLDALGAIMLAGVMLACGLWAVLMGNLFRINQDIVEINRSLKSCVTRMEAINGGLRKDREPVPEAGNP